MDYAKIVNGSPEYVRLPLRLSADMVINGVTHPSGGDLHTNDPAVLSSFGYKPVVRADMPVRDGYYYTVTWTESEGAITQGWEEHETPPDQTADMLAALELLGVEQEEGNG